MTSRERKWKVLDDAQRSYEVRALVALAGIEGIGPSRMARLLNEFGAASAVLAADQRDLVDRGRMSEHGAAIVADTKAVGEGHPITAYLGEDHPHGRLVVYSDRDYPELLRQLSQPPMWYWEKGQRASDRALHVAIVGSRRATVRGKALAMDWAYKLASIGITVVSGLAEGIDTAAHRGALDSGGHTIGVMGTGMDRVYPVANRALASEISEHSLLMTEFSPGTGARAHHFPRRNRIIAGLCQAVIVMEAAKGSGSLITAKIAQDHGREVGIVPGRPGDANARGANAAIKENLGALVFSIEDVLELLGYTDHVHNSRKTPTPVLESNLDPDVARTVERVVHAGPVSFEKVSDSTGIPHETLEEVLLSLLSEGRIVLDGNQRYCKAS